MVAKKITLGTHNSYFPVLMDLSSAKSTLMVMQFTHTKTAQTVKVT